MEYSPLMPKGPKPFLNILSVLIGPLFLFVLIIVDISIRLQESQITGRGIIKIILGNAAPKFKIGKSSKKPEIKLVDSSGRSFHEIYGSQGSKKASADILSFTEEIISDGIHQRASDILIDPKSGGIYTIRLRIDGVLKIVSQIDSDKCNAVVNSIKAIAKMDISEKRRPQDGAFLARMSDGEVYFRVSSAGVLGGEKLSIRILNQKTGLLNLDEIGLSEKNIVAISEILQQPSGMVIICGPTGSGKTTSLYAMLSTMDFFTRNVVTVEDPIEYKLPDISQIEVNVKANINFVNALRSILRQDPDVICVGEIRDKETAGMALQASHTGHLVLATLHSSSNIAALVRLMDLGIKPMLLAEALNVVISQRLVRKLCDNCKVYAELSEDYIADLRKKQIDHTKIMAPNGCHKCDGTGYRGRTAILDVMVLDDRIKASLVNADLAPSDLINQGNERSRAVFMKNGFQKVLSGITTFDEVKKVTTNLG
jgi:type II secretory ATPase GspE/PulE/Tfp pilus assembly ATPase PilB-like protein